MKPLYDYCGIFHTYWKLFLMCTGTFTTRSSSNFRQKKILCSSIMNARWNESNLHLIALRHYWTVLNYGKSFQSYCAQANIDCENKNLSFFNGSGDRCLVKQCLLGFYLTPKRRLNVRLKQNCEQNFNCKWPLTKPIQRNFCIAKWFILMNYSKMWFFL